MSPGASRVTGVAGHGCSAVCFQAVLHRRILLISQYSELSCLLGIQVPNQSITCHLVALLISLVQAKQQHGNATVLSAKLRAERATCPSVEQELGCGEEEEEGKENEEELLGL